MSFNHIERRKYFYLGIYFYALGSLDSLDKKKAKLLFGDDDSIRTLGLGLLPSVLRCEI